MQRVQRFDFIKSLPRRATLVVATGLGLLTLTEPARAQSGYFYLDRAQLSGAPDDGFMVFRPYIPKETRFYGMAALGYSHNPLRSDTVVDNQLIEDAIDNPVQGQLTLYMLAGMQILGRAGVSLSLPITIVNITGRDPQSEGVGTGGIDDHVAAVHDLRLDGRVHVWETDDRKARFGGGVALFFPTGNAGAFASDDGTTGWLFANGEYHFDDFFLVGQIGPHFRPENSFGGINGALHIGTELRFGLGAYMPLRENRIRLGLEIFGSTGLESSLGPNSTNTIFSGRNTPLEWLGQIRYVLEKHQNIYLQGGLGTRLAIGYGAPDFRLLASIGTFFGLPQTKPAAPPPKVRVVPDASDYDRDTDGDGYPDAIDKCPTVKEDGKEPEPSDGCPAGTDRDGDGIPDVADDCPDKPEDKDGVQDTDGCPEEDPDNDQIPDKEDRCPTTPGPRSDIAEKNGCPQLTRVREDGEVELLRPIEFEFAKAVIKPESYPILDEVVTLLRARPDLRIGIYGHTDNQGALELNMRLSRDRARACLTYIVNKGIAPGRLESQGFGPNKPVADNATDEGRARNRRVEFKILE